LSGSSRASRVDLHGRPIAVGLVLTATGSVQFGAAYATTLFDRLGPGGTAFLRLAIAAVVLWALWRPRIGGHARADLRIAALFGMSLGFMNWSFYEALHRIPLGVAVTLEFLGPLSVAVLGSRRRLDGVWAALAAAGVLGLVRPWEGEGALDPVGVGLALFAGLMWAAYILLASRTGRLFPGGGGLAIAMVVGALVVLPAGVVQGGGDLLVVHLLLAAAVVAFASSIVPYSLELEALRRLPESVFGVLMSVEPAVAALAGWIVLEQALGTADVLSIGLVVVATAGAASLGRRG
jgi:inner membrane transporter RhtA